MEGEDCDEDDEEPFFDFTNCSPPSTTGRPRTVSKAPPNTSNRGCMDKKFGGLLVAANSGSILYHNLIPQIVVKNFQETVRNLITLKIVHYILMW